MAEREVESRRFVARDAAGAEVEVVAERAVAGPEGGLRDPGEYRTADGRRVVPGAEYGVYVVEADGARLTTDDPREPRDWA